MVEVVKAHLSIQTPYDFNFCEAKMTPQSVNPDDVELSKLKARQRLLSLVKMTS